ncbi:hypothetical protein [Streptomyces roseolus]
MVLPPGGTVLDALDAYLEARWDGAVGQAAEVPEQRAGEGALAGWVRERLRELPPGPTADSALRAGTLLREFRSRRSAWNAAALRLLDDTYTFVATGPRRHDDWAHDVRAVMHRSVRDPRGWIRLDGDRAGDVRRALPAYPFDPPDAAGFPARLRSVDADTAVGALAVMAEEWQGEAAPVRTRPDRDALLADARVLLDRYGAGACYWTNATTTAAGGLDFVAAGLAGTRSHSFLTSAYVGGLDLLEDLGLIAVSADEVGVFWSIGAY